MCACVCVCVHRRREKCWWANRLSEVVNDSAAVFRIRLLSITQCTHKCYQLFGHWHLKNTDTQTYSILIKLTRMLIPEPVSRGSDMLWGSLVNMASWTPKKYKETLDENLVASAKKIKVGGDWIFQQDNNPKIIQWIKSNVCLKLQWKLKYFTYRKEIPLLTLFAIDY